MRRIIKTVVSICLVATMVVTSFGVYNKEVKAYTVDVDTVNGGNTFLQTGMEKATYTVNGVVYNNYMKYEGIFASSNSEARKAENAVDGTLGSRWESQHGVDNVYLQVDLGNTYAIKIVGIYWEDASAQKYTLQGSTDGKNFTDIKEVESTSRERTDQLTFSEAQNIRFLRVYCTERNTTYGNSIFEIAAFGLDNQKEVVPQVSKLNVTDYSKWTGKYLIYFNRPKNATGYRVYIDNETTPIKTINAPGDYITYSDLSKYSVGDHTLSVAALYVEDGQTKETEKATQTITKAPDEGIFTEIPQVYIKSGEITTNYRDKADVNVTIVDQSGGSKGLGTVDDTGAHKDGTKITSYSDVIDADCNIKVRGNTTATQPKKAWNIKFSGKTSILGMPKGKKWNFLANSMDKSLMRDTLSYNFGLQNGVRYTSQSRYADVYLNGEYMGNYQVCEPVEAKSNRVEIDAYDGESDDILLEYGTRNEEGVDHFTTSRFGITFDVNDPEKDDDLDNDLVDAKIARVKAYLDNFEDALRFNINDLNTIAQYIDIDSFVDYYIANEYFKNVDFNFSSTRFYMKGGKLYAGPMWDLDLSSGNCKSSYYKGYYVNGDSSKGYYCRGIEWYKRLFTNEQFVAKVKQRFYDLQYRIQSIYRDDSTEVNSIKYLVNRYSNSFERNYRNKSQKGAGWAVNAEDGYSYAGESGWRTWNEPIEFLQNWLSRRNAWLCSEWGIDMDEAYAQGKDNETSTTQAPTTTQASTTTQEPTTSEVPSATVAPTEVDPPTILPTTKKKPASKTPETVVILKAKKSAKKLKITLKKAENVSGYQVAVYKSKKNAKKNKKSIIKTHVISLNIKLKLKKFKKKKLYVRARAYAIYTGKVYYGGWSKIKKVK